MGWKVLRFWGSEIDKELDKCIQKIERIIKGRKEQIENERQQPAKS